MRPKLQTLFQLLKQTANEWSDDNASRLSAALAYYTVLSIAPLLMLATAVVGFVFGEDAARGQVASELAGIVGPQAGQGIQTVIQHARSPEGGLISSIVGVAVLMFGASGVFGELQSAMNVIWDVKPKPGLGVKGFIRARFFSFTMVLGVAFLLLVSLVLSALLAAAGRFFAHHLPGGEVLWQGINFLFSLLIISALFALIFKVVPDVKVSWRDVAPGAVLTAILFTIGKLLLGLYLGHSSVASPYGAAGSVIVLVIWVYYSAQILFFGAEFAQVYTRQHRVVVPQDNAVRVDEQRQQSHVRSWPDSAERGSGREPLLGQGRRWRQLAYFKRSTCCSIHARCRRSSASPRCSVPLTCVGTTALFTARSYAVFVSSSLVFIAARMALSPISPAITTLPAASKRLASGRVGGSRPLCRKMALRSSV